MARKQGLVGRDDMATGAQRGFHGSLGRTVLAADQLNENVDIGRFGQFDRIVEPGNTGKINTTVPRAVAGADRRNRYRLTALAREHFGLVTQDTQHRSTNGAGPATPIRNASLIISTFCMEWLNRVGSHGLHEAARDHLENIIRDDLRAELHSAGSRPWRRGTA